MCGGTWKHFRILGQSRYTCSVGGPACSDFATSLIASPTRQNQRFVLIFALFIFGLIFNRSANADQVRQVTTGATVTAEVPKLLIAPTPTPVTPAVLVSPEAPRKCEPPSPPPRR